MTTACDVVVLGMGTSGEDAALRLATAGLDVVGIEANLIGGECPYWACIPTKWLVRTANLLTEARRADGVVGRVNAEPDWSIVAAQLREQVTGGWDDSTGVARFEAKGGRFIRGWGKLVGPRTVQVEGETVEARTGVLVATGSSPFIPPIPGLAEVDYWTNHDAVEAEDIPESLVILGGGPMGCELGQIFARFGVDVTIVEGADRILANGEPEASAVITEAMTHDGVAIVTGSHAAKVSADDRTVTVTLETGQALVAERILVATGRRADAEAAGVTAAGATVDRGFVEVDGLMRAADGLWAIGDVTGRGLLTQVAEYQGRIAVEDILGAQPTPADYSVNPMVTFTDPEVGSVGVTEEQATGAGHQVQVVVKELQRTFRGWLHRTGNTGFIKLVVAEGRLIGATVVGPRAGDVLGLLALAVKERTPVGRLMDSIYAFPTFYGGIGEALGAYGRGITRVLDPETAPLFEDPTSQVGTPLDSL